MVAKRRLSPAERMTSLGVNFRAKTRAELELLAKGRNRTVNWCIRRAVEIQLAADNAELQDYAILYPELAARITELTEGVTKVNQVPTSADSKADFNKENKGFTGDDK